MAKTFQRDTFSVRVNRHKGEIFYCLFDITRSLKMKNGRTIKSAIERAYKCQLKKFKIDTDHYSFLTQEQLEHFLRLYSTSADFNAFIREIPYWYKSQEAKESIVKESQVVEPQVVVPSVVEKENLLAENPSDTQSDVKVFSFNNFDIETIFNNGEPFFRLRDIVGILNISRTTASNWIANNWFDDDEIVDVINYDIGGKPLKYVAESGLYRILNRTNSPKARPFERWVTKEVLPSLRKNGGYIAGQESMSELEIIANALVVANNVIQQKSKELETIKALRDKEKPLVDFANQVASASNSISVGEFAKLLNDEQIKIGQNNLFKWLRSNKYLMSDNMPYQKYINRGYFEVVEQTYKTTSGSKVSLKTLVTGKGQIYFTEKLRNRI